jgi:transcriptional regulator with XRE-family HTH domain
VDELEAALGAAVRALRLDLNIDQHTVAERAGISTGALKNLENGRGSTVRTLASVLKALGREDWLATLAPVASINPLSHTAAATPRRRASARPVRD